MKVSWRLTTEQKPSDERSVLVTYKNGEQAICYYDTDGDWVESCTALVEHHDGKWEIVTWQEIENEDKKPSTKNVRSNNRKRY